ncbi:MAG: 4Fe-4S binding protein [Paramuribaculum sp.]|nr:4Fe-4S binding protein [Paramuribaculum sp.]
MINRLLRYGRIAISLIVWCILTIGFILPTVSLAGVAGYVEHLEIVLAVTMSVSIFAIWLLVTMVFGRVYCSTFCPVGTLQDIAARAVRLTPRARERRRYRYSQPCNAARYGILALMALLLMGGAVILTSILNPALAYERICTDLTSSLGRSTLISAGIAASLLFIILIAGALTGRTLCNTACPVGTMLGLISRYSIFQIDIDTDKCIQCGRCADVCKGHCVDLTDHVIDGSRCVCCFDCINVCPNDAIRYTTSRKRLSQPLMQRIGEPPAEEEGVEATITGSTDNSTPTS